jgi:hypothetical protein
MAASGASPEQRRDSLDDGLREAGQQGKLVLLDFYSET